MRNSFGMRLSGGGGRRGEFGVGRLIIRELKLVVGSTLGTNRNGDGNSSMTDNDWRAIGTQNFILEREVDGGRDEGLKVVLEVGDAMVFLIARNEALDAAVVALNDVFGNGDTFRIRGCEVGVN